MRPLQQRLVVAVVLVGAGLGQGHVLDSATVAHRHVVASREQRLGVVVTERPTHPARILQRRRRDVLDDGGGVARRLVRKHRARLAPHVDIGHALRLRRGKPLRVTRYCATGDTTTSGSWPRVGDVATLSRAVPFGTRVVVDGLGAYTVTDRIGHGSDVDIFTAGPHCNAVADAFGRQTRRVIFEGGK